MDFELQKLLCIRMETSMDVEQILVDVFGELTCMRVLREVYMYKSRKNYASVTSFLINLFS